MKLKFWLKSILLFIPMLCHAEVSVVWEETQIPMQTSSGPITLSALLVYPNDQQKHPVALINHGSPRDAKDRSSLAPIQYLSTANEFARRGYAVAVVARRGYGDSGGGWAESYGPCKNPDYLKAAHASSEDLHAVIEYLSTVSTFDTNNLLVVGHSAGGFATVALTAINPPKGLKAAISFAGGRGSYDKDKVCNEDRLVAAFAQLGKLSRVPMLWVYAENDHFFGPALVQKLITAFKAGGGKATLISAQPFGDEGHFLFSEKGKLLWTQMVDNFLKQQHMPRLDPLLPLPRSGLRTPDFLSVNGKKAFTSYKQSPMHKAFAASQSSAFGWRSGQKTIQDAKQAALANCQQYSSDCELIAVDEQMR